MGVRDRSRKDDWRGMQPLGRLEIGGEVRSCMQCERMVTVGNFGHWQADLSQGVRSPS